ncbi:MAG: hypothetical protein Q9218_000902 [Villophora microphyllina]
MGLAITLLAFFREILVPGEASESPQAGGLEETILDSRPFARPTTMQLGQFWSGNQPAPQRAMTTNFLTRVSNTTANYSRVMVIPRMQEDDISWIVKELPDLDVAVYVANNPRALMHPPRNKGHEVMIYLSYLIDNYERLPDIVLFMHSHRWTHHNNNLLGFDASQMIRALNGAHVMRQGYVNMRCQWSPGCPEWLRPISLQESLSRQEETVLERCWKELFPFDQLPAFLAQPCCAQFALSKDQIRSIPQSRYVFYRDWILRTPLSDYISGRIWEYSWQFLFSGKSINCPLEHVCYCDGFGMCFGGKQPYEEYLKLFSKRDNVADELRQGNLTYPIVEINGSVQDHGSRGDTRDQRQRWAHLTMQLEDLEADLIARRRQAQTRGADPRLRAEESGRWWKEGDGF